VIVDGPRTTPDRDDPVRRSTIDLTQGSGTWTVTAADYLLQLRVPQLTAVLADPDQAGPRPAQTSGGRIWSRLSMLASVGDADESYAVAEPRVSTVDDFVEIEVASQSTVWATKSVLLRCFEDRVEARVRVTGDGPVGTVRLLGGRATLPTGACGTFRSSIDFASVFDPTPTEPVQVVRPAHAGAALGVVGDASAGRLHGVFSPPPLMLAFGREPARTSTDVPDGGWLSLGIVAPVDELRFAQLRYAPLDGGFLIELDYDGQTTVDGEFVTPAVVLRRVEDPWQGLRTYRDDLVHRGFAPEQPAHDQAGWWTEPIFCGWGAQCAAAPIPGQPMSYPVFVHDLGPAVVPPELPIAPDLARQDHYDTWLDKLATHGVVPGTVVVDDRWQLDYGTAEPDPGRWPDLRAWIAKRHTNGQRVLLWWKAWDPGGLDPAECVLDPAGTPVAADPGSPAYLDRLASIVTRLLSLDGLDADGLKVDFTQRAPTGTGLTRPGADDRAPWGIAALHRLLETMHRAAKAAKPDALVVTHTPHPGFGDVCDMVRLNDVLERDPTGEPVPAAGQLAFRHAVAAASLPHHPVDTDQWPIADRAQWRAYVVAQALTGVPALYYVDGIDRSGESLTTDDLALVAETWRAYRDDR
jgi:hypothetical protein